MAGPECFRFRLLRALFRVQLSGDRSVFVNPRTFLPVGATFVVHSQVKSKWYFRSRYRLAVVS